MNCRALMIGGLLVALVGFGSTAPTDNEDSVRALRLANFVLPQFPGPVQVEGLVEGQAVVAISRDASGNVVDALALESTHPGYAEAAVDAVKRWRFEPSPIGALQPQAVPLVRFLFHEGGVIFVAGPAGRLGKKNAPLASFFQPAYRVASFEDLDGKPRALHQPMPAMPAALRGKLAQGAVSVTFFVDAAGHVRVPSVLEASSPELGAAVVETISQWRYEPPRLHGQPTVVMERWSFNFGPEPRS